MSCRTTLLITKLKKMSVKSYCRLLNLLFLFTSTKTSSFRFVKVSQGPIICNAQNSLHGFKKTLHSSPQNEYWLLIYNMLAVTVHEFNKIAQTFGDESPEITLLYKKSSKQNKCTTSKQA